MKNSRVIKLTITLLLKTYIKHQKCFEGNFQNDSRVCGAVRLNEIVTYEKDKTEEKYISEWPQTIF